MKYNLIAALTTKNEDWIIDKTLRSLSQYCDEIIVYDDGSDDDTEKICRSYDKVAWKVRDSHDPLIREEAKQRLELINLVRERDPEYVLLLDADEIPTPSVIDFMNNVDSSINLWRCRMINLWEDKSKYRVDSYRTKFGTGVNFDPFGPHAWFKYPLLKYNRDIDYHYDINIQKGGCSQYHPAPGNVPKPIGQQEDFYIMHYGKIAPNYLNEDRLKFYASIEAKDGKGSFDQRLEWHQEHNRTDTLKTVETKKEWFWV